MPFFRATEQQGLAWTQRLHSAVCESNLRRIGSAARFYAADYNGRFPADWRSFTSYLVSFNPQGPESLYCPSDAAHPPAADWDTVDLAAISYELVSPGMREGDWERVFARCFVHSNVVAGDGVVQPARAYDRRPIPMSRAGSAVFNLGSYLTTGDGAWSNRCLNQLKQIGLAARLYANDNNDRFPPDFEAITNELGRAQVLICPADLLQPRPVSFAELDWATIDYVLDGAGVRPLPGQTGMRLASCRIHGHFVDSEGMVKSSTNRYPPRLIVGHPLSQTVTPGQPATLAVLTGDPALAPFRFQWRRIELFDAAGLALTNVQFLADATNRTYEIAAATMGDEGYYYVVVEDALGGRQLSHLAYVRVESVANPLAVAGWETNACALNLRNLYLASRLAQTSHATTPEDVLPADIPALAPFLGWPLALYCPADTQHAAPDAWETLQPLDTSYLVSRGVSTENTNAVFATCKVHGLQALSDGRFAWPGLEAIRPELRSPALLPEGTIRLTVGGIAGLECVVEVSPDLRIWTVLAQDWLNGGLLLVTESVRSEPGIRFYRARYR